MRMKCVSFDMLHSQTLELMPRKPQPNIEELRPFARWMMGRLATKGKDLKWLATETGIDYTYLFKVKFSFRPQYNLYQKPSYEYAVKLGDALDDTYGAIRAGNFPQSEASIEDGEVGDRDPDREWIIEKVSNQKDPSALRQIRRVLEALEESDDGRAIGHRTK